jgi:hypothetical protein
VVYFTYEVAGGGGGGLRYSSTHSEPLHLVHAPDAIFLKKSPGFLLVIKLLGPKASVDLGVTAVFPDVYRRCQSYTILYDRLLSGT